MFPKSTRRQFLTRSGSALAGITLGLACDNGQEGNSAAEEPRAPASRVYNGPDGPARAEPRVVIARDDTLTRGKLDEHRDLLRKLLDASMQKLLNTPDAVSAWRRLFSPKQRVGLKVNTLGFSTHPAVVDAVVAGLRQAGVPAKNIIIWDRLDVELSQAGFKLNKSVDGVQCRGTDAEQRGSGYQSQIESNGQIGSCFSRIVAEQVDTLISVPVLKDHNLAGVSLGLKNFYGAIHNPSKYHDNNCDPYIADVVAHRFIGPKWRLTVCDATHAQYNAGPTRHPGFAWPFGGLIVSRNVVAADAIAADLLEKQRKAKGLESLAAGNRPAKHIATAAARGLGEADLSKIELIEV